MNDLSLPRPSSEVACIDVAPSTVAKYIGRCRRPLEDLSVQPCRRNERGADGPALCQRAVNGRYQRLVGRRQDRIGPVPGKQRQRRVLAAAGGADEKGFLRIAVAKRALLLQLYRAEPLAWVSRRYATVRSMDRATIVATGDQLWSFVYRKQQNAKTAKRQDMAYGAVWTRRFTRTPSTSRMTLPF